MNILFNKTTSKTQMLPINKYVKNTACVFLIILGIYVVFNNILYCGFVGDENYQALCVKDYTNSPITMLLFFNAHVWTELFGFSILSLRIFCRICCIFSICLGCGYLWYKSKNFLVTATAFVISCLIYNLGCFGIYNWDTGAYPIEAIWAILIVAYIDHPSKILTIALGVTCGIMTMTRLPLSVAIIPTIIILYLSSRPLQTNLKHFWGKQLLFWISCVIIFLIFVILMTGSVHNYFLSFNQNNLISGHSLDQIHKYLWIFQNQFPFVFISWVPIIYCYVGAILWHKNATNKYIKTAIFCIGIILFWSVLRVSARMDDYDNPIFGIGLPLIIVPGIIIPFIANRYHTCINLSHNKSKNQLLTLLFFTLIIGMGSDAMFERWTSIFLFPMILGTIWGNITDKCMHVIKTWLTFTIILLTFIWTYKSIAATKSYVWSETTIESRGNIPSFPDFASVLSEIPQDIENLNMNDGAYTFWGYYRYPLTLEFEKTPRYSIQTFHYSSMDIKNTIPDIAQLDYLFLTFHKNATEIEKDRLSLIHTGFSVCKTGTHYILMKNMHKNEK